MERVYATNGLWLNGFADDGAVNTISELMSGAAGAPVRAVAAKCTAEAKGSGEQKKKKELEVQKKTIKRKKNLDHQIGNCFRDATIICTAGWSHYQTLC